MLRVGRYGPYLERGEQRAAIPADLPPDELDLERALELLEQGPGPRELGVRSGDAARRALARSGRFGPYVTEVAPEDDEKAEDEVALPA